MRLSATALSLVLVAGAFLGAGAQPCRADAPRVADVQTYTSAPLAEAPRPGTDDEERVYAQRESESPDAQEFTGGWVVEFLLVVVLVLLIVVLARKI